MADLRCEIQKILEPQDPSVTVGERFVLLCRGEVPELNPSSAEVRLDPADKYKLKVLRWERESGSELKLEAISSQVGKHALAPIQIVDEGTSVVIPELQFETRSVQDPQNPVQEPFGSIGPVAIGVPWIYWIALLGVVAFMGAVTAWRVLVRVQRRNLMREILSQAGADRPETELYRTLRRFQRESFYLLDPAAPVPAGEARQALDLLGGAYLLFLSRRFDLPASRWSARRTLSTLARENREIDPEALKRVRAILREIRRSNEAELRSRDLAQLAAWIRESGQELARVERRP